MCSATLPTTRSTDSELWRDLKKFLLINLIIAAILQVYFCPVCLTSLDGIIEIIPEFLFSFFVSMALSFGGSRVQEYWDRRLPWVQQPVKRLFATVITYLIYAFGISFLIVFVFTWIDGQFPLSNIPWSGILKFTFTPMKIALIFMAIFTSRSWLLEWRKSAIEAEQLRSEKFASQYQSLKDQLNPHFLFNSLNVLSNLVYEDADKSAAFIQKLSKIYRYVLEVQQEELVSLRQELDFAKNYLELQKIRFEENLIFSIKMENENGFFIPPLSLQLLLENAIKHNVASQDHPLFIQILQKEQELWISNSFQPKSTRKDESPGIGLNNIRMRYMLLSDLQLEVAQDENEFLVKLPLLRITK
jgi:sensor histidine kinase YesM